MLYEEKLSHKDINAYIDWLIKNIFSILPLYEEYGGISKTLNSKIRNVIFRISGFLETMDYPPGLSLDILALCNGLKHAESHRDIRSLVLKICSMLSKLKVGDVGES